MVRKRSNRVGCGTGKHWHRHELTKSRQEKLQDRLQLRKNFHAGKQ